MLYDAKGFEKIYVAPEYTDMRKGIDGLAIIIGRDLKLNPYQKNVLFLFCGRQSSKIKCLVWEGDGFVLLYKRLESGSFTWPRTPQEGAPASAHPPVQMRKERMTSLPFAPVFNYIMP